jgi:ribonuclease HI
MDEFQRTGWGFAIYKGTDLIKTGNGALGAAEVFDAEAIAALEGLQAAIQITTDQIYICIDNTAVLWCLHGRPSDSSQAAFLRFKALASQHGHVGLRWAPGHMGIEGNEAADKLAKKGCEKDPPSMTATTSYAKRQLRRSNRATFDNWWRQYAPNSFRHLVDGDLVPREEASLRARPSLKIPRASLGRWLAARSFHGDFASYHKRFNHEDAHLLCSCKHEKTPEHYAYCQRVWKLKHKWPAKLRKHKTPYQLYDYTIDDAAAFHELTTATNFFMDICPRRPRRLSLESVNPDPTSPLPSTLA